MSWHLQVDYNTNSNCKQLIGNLHIQPVLGHVPGKGKRLKQENICTLDYSSQ